MIRQRVTFTTLPLLAVLGVDRQFHGAIVNPDTGCFALVKNACGDRRQVPARIYADSAMVFRQARRWKGFPLGPETWGRDPKCQGIFGDYSVIPSRADQ